MLLPRPLLILATALPVFVTGVACTPSTSAQKAPVTADSSSATANAAPEEPVSAVEPPQAQPEATPPVPACADPAPPVVDVAPRVAVRPIAVPRVSGPYRVHIVDAASHDLPTYTSGGRTYVMGTVGARYAIAISNPTAQRVEAVVSVDGLDAMDGHAANYAAKRGYVIAAHDDVSIDGFRTSFDQVATFRFSSVADSYAGRLGEARDVGVIGVAFFPEALPVYEPPPPAPAAAAPIARSKPRASYHSPSPSPAAPPADNAGPPAKSSAGAPSRLSDLGGGAGGLDKSESQRRGLGTEFGEARDSRIGSTSFDRANRTVPSEVVAIRYNDRAGLIALGIRIEPVYPSADLTLRETAEPFRSNGFAQPPP